MIVVSRLGAASAPWVAQYLNEVHEVLPFTVMGGLGVIASIICFKLKETNGVPTAETMDGAENNGKCYKHCDTIVTLFNLELQSRGKRQCCLNYGLMTLKSLSTTNQGF